VYTSDRYLVGRGFSDHPDAKERGSEAQNDALAMLSRSIRSHITSHFETLRRENADAFSETTEVLNTSTSDIEVSGVHFETSREGKWLHVLAHISYEEARNVHSAIATRWAREASDQLQSARQLVEEGEHARARQAYARVFPLIAHIDDAVAVLIAARGAAPELPFTRSQVVAEAEALEDAPVSSLADAADRLVHRLADSGVLGARIRIKPFTYARTDFSSPFSYHFYRLLESQLGDRVVVLDGGFKPKSIGYTREESRLSGAETILIGTYRETEDAVYVSARGIGADMTLRASADIMIPKTLIVGEKLSLRPQNYLQAQQDAGLIAEGEVLSGDLRIELWTDHGRDALLFTANQRYKVFVRVNRACTVQLIYHLADGTRVVMYEEYPIPSHMVNLAVEIPTGFVVVPPYGAEIIHAFAYTGQPPHLATIEQVISGERYTVMADSLATVMEGFHKGFRRDDTSDDSDAGIGHAATVQLPLTTIGYVSSID
jgi:hypothetical protein